MSRSRLNARNASLLPAFALARAPKALSQYEIDLVARDANVPQITVRQLRQCAALPCALASDPPSAERAPHRPLPKAVERVAQRGEEIFGDVGQALRRKARRQPRRAYQIVGIFAAGLQKCHDSHQSLALMRRWSTSSFPANEKIFRGDEKRSPLA